MPTEASEAAAKFDKIHRDNTEIAHLMLDANKAHTAPVWHHGFADALREVTQQRYFVPEAAEEGPEQIVAKVSQVKREVVLQWSVWNCVTIWQVRHLPHLPAPPRISTHLHASPRISTHLHASPRTSCII